MRAPSGRTCAGVARNGARPWRPPPSLGIVTFGVEGFVALEARSPAAMVVRRSGAVPSPASPARAVESPCRPASASEPNSCRYVSGSFAPVRPDLASTNPGVRLPSINWNCRRRLPRSCSFAGNPHSAVHFFGQRKSRQNAIYPAHRVIHMDVPQYRPLRRASFF